MIPVISIVQQFHSLHHTQDWERVMKYQRKNGSLFNSPSTTAAAFMQLQAVGCLNYLCSLLEKFDMMAVLPLVLFNCSLSVPTVYPLDMYARLCLVDNLVRLGIERHFRQEIASLHVGWNVQMLDAGDEEIFRDTTTCAMAFRLLRISGYDVSSIGSIDNMGRKTRLRFPWRTTKRYWCLP